MSLQIITLTAAAILAASMPTRAETLLVERVQKETGTALPARGATTSEVQARFGAPVERLEPRGGQKRQWPAIQRWAYPEFIVYFEKGRVIDAVVNRSSTNEIGPRTPEG